MFNTDQTIFNMVKTKTEIWFWIMSGGLEHLACVILLSGPTWENKLWLLKNKNAGKWNSRFLRFSLMLMCIVGFLVEVISWFWYQNKLRSLVSDRKIYAIYKLKNQGQIKVKLYENSQEILKNQAFLYLNDLELLFNRIHISYDHHKFILRQ